MISGRNSRAGAWTGLYVKVCAPELAQLRQWRIEQVGEPIRPCGSYARKVTVARRRERVRRLHRLAPNPQDLDQLVRTDPSMLNVSVEDMHRALTESRPAAGT